MAAGRHPDNVPVVLPALDTIAHEMGEMHVYHLVEEDLKNMIKRFCSGAQSNLYLRPGLAMYPWHRCMQSHARPLRGFELVLLYNLKTHFAAQGFKEEQACYKLVMDRMDPL